jgi:hypothetical protein
MCRLSHVGLVGRVALELPFLVVERAHSASAKPSADAVEVKCVKASAPRHRTVATGGRTAALVGLALDAQLLQSDSAGWGDSARSEWAEQSGGVGLLHGLRVSAVSGVR